jgi:2-methylcitrate dehydratase PrpD
VIGTRSLTACERLAERVLTVSAAPDDALAEIVSMRVFDTVGALAVASAAVGDSPLDLSASGLDGPLATLRRLCAITRFSEVDDIERRSCTTPGSVAVPVALLLSVGREVSGATLIAAVAAGYEAMVTIGEAIDGAQALYRGIWPSYLGAPLAAAATAARLFELDERQTVDALAIAAARVVGVVGRPAREPTSRWFLYGCAAADGVAAAHAAQRGIAGDSRVLEAALGLHTQDEFREIAPAADTAAVARVDVKPFCTARQAQAAIEAAQRASESLPDLTTEEIETIEVGVPEAYVRMIDQPRVADRITSIMSAQFQIAAALSDRDVLYDVARTNARPGDVSRRLMAIVTVAADPELTPLFPAVWPARVRIRASGGREASAEVLEPDGAGVPMPGWSWLEHKHEALRSFDGELRTVSEICRNLAAGAAVPARELLDLILQEGTAQPDSASRDQRP